MRKLHGLILLAVLAVSPVLAQSAAPEDAFNQARLRSGADLYQEKMYREAIEQFRVAAFGYLDQPVRLSECLARLALAQVAAEKPDAEATLGRFVELERRSPSYARADLEPDVRTAFQALLLARVPQTTIAGIPSLAGLIETEEQKFARLPAAERRKAYEAAARREPGAIRWPIALAREALERGNAKDAERWAEMAMTIDPASPDAIAVRARARVARGQYGDALKDFSVLPAGELEKRPELYADKFVSLVETQDWAGAQEALPRIPATLSGRSDVSRASQKLAVARPRPGREAPPAGGEPSAKIERPGASPGGRAPSAPPMSPTEAAARNRDALAESRRLISSGRAEDAGRLLADALKADPNNRDLRLAMLEAACLTRSYKVAAAQLPQVMPFREAEAPSMFYAAVVFYETGRVDEARAYLERAMPKVSGQLVDEYARKILGRP